MYAELNLFEFAAQGWLLVLAEIQMCWDVSIPSFPS
jgi:hypothetical protein